MSRLSGEPRKSTNDTANPVPIAAPTPKKFVNLSPPVGPNPTTTLTPVNGEPVTASQNPGPSVSQIDLSACEDDVDRDPYLDELLDVLDRVETEGEPYLEKLIVQAGLEFFSHSETEVANEKLGKKKVFTRKRTGKSLKTKVGVVEPASDEDDYRKLYGTHKEGAGQMLPDDSRSSRSSTSTESLADSLAAMIARGELPILEEKPSGDLSSYGAKVIPYGSFDVNNADVGVVKYAQSDAIIRVAHVAGALSVEELDKEEKIKHTKEKVDCVDDSTDDLISTVDFEEDLYDEGKSQEMLVDERDGPPMVLLSSSEDEDDLDPPQQYYEYTKQESQCLAIVSNSRRQFTDAYPERKALFLTPVNVGE